MHWHIVEARIRYLTSDEGGRRDPVANGYRGQFFYDGDDCDGFQLFPDFDPFDVIPLGQEVRAFIQFPQTRWEQVHRLKVHEGMKFEIHEGSRTVGKGTVTRLEVDEAEWSHLNRLR